MSIELSPIILALISSFLFSLGVQFQYIGLSVINSRTGTAISITTAACIYWLLSPLFLDHTNWFHSSVFIFVLVGIFRPSLSANLAVAGTRYLGPTLSTTLSSTTPLFGSALGVWWLGEIFTWQIALGTCGIIAAVILLSFKNLRLNADWPIWALGLPVGAAVLRSLAHVLSKIGMEDIADPYFVGLIGFTVSALITNIFLKGIQSPMPVYWHTKGPYWFVLSGLVMSAAILSLNTALLNGEITTVVPIVAASPVFSMLLSIIIFKREKLTSTVVLAVFMVVPSVIFIAMSR
jgi:DME family drug/metabolite transporter